VALDAGAQNNVTTLPTSDAAGLVTWLPSQAETNADTVSFFMNDVLGDEWEPLTVMFDTRDATAIANGVPLAATATSAQLVDDIWDEVLTAATHNVGYSAAQRIRYLLITGGQAQGGASDTIILAAAESAIDHIFDENIISIVGGTGAGQTRLVSEYHGASKTVTVDRAWHVAPNATSIYEITPFSSVLLSDHGEAQAGAAGSITLAATASAINDSYVGSDIFISSGAGVGQVRLITAYVGATRVASISPDWTVTPDATSVYKVLPVGRVIVESVGATGQDNIRDAILDDATRFSGADIGTILTDTGTTIPGLLATAQGDLDTLTGADGATLATVQPNYAPAKAGDAMALTVAERTTLADAIWNFTQRTLTSFGTLVVNIWEYASRTLTMSLASVLAMVSGTTITVYRGDTMACSLTVTIGAATKVWFTVKQAFTQSDADATIQITNPGGLVRLNAAPTTAGWGSLVVAANAITINVSQSAMQSLVPGSYYYDVKSLVGGVLTTKAAGLFIVLGDVTNAIA
jgi:hypothetical protein